MTLGLIATPLAWLNYQKAQKAYDEAKQKYASLKGQAQKAVDDYQREKEILDTMNMHRDPDGAINRPLPGVDVQVGLNLGNLGGKRLAAESFVAISNNSGRALNVMYVGVKLSVWDMKHNNWIPLYAPESGGLGYSPYFDYSTKGQTIIDKSTFMGEFAAVEGLQALSKQNMALLRDSVAAMYGKRLVTSILKKNRYTLAPSKEYLKADVGIIYRYKLDSGDTVVAQSLHQNVFGAFCYRGEAYYPKPIGLMDVVWTILTVGITLFKKMSEMNNNEEKSTPGDK